MEEDNPPPPPPRTGEAAIKPAPAVPPRSPASQPSQPALHHHHQTTQAQPASSPVSPAKDADEKKKATSNNGKTSAASTPKKAAASEASEERESLNFPPSWNTKTKIRSKLPNFPRYVRKKNKKLRHAVEAVDLARVRRALTQGADINAPDADDGLCPLHVAVLSVHAATCGASPCPDAVPAADSPTSSNGSDEPAPSAVVSSSSLASGSSVASGSAVAPVGALQILLIQALLAYGANKDQRDNTPEKNTALHVATSRGLHSVLSILLDAGADVTIANSAGALAIEDAVEKSHTHIVRMLLRAGCNQANTVTHKLPVDVALAKAVAAGAADACKEAQGRWEVVRDLLHVERLIGEKHWTSLVATLKERQPGCPDLKAIIKDLSAIVPPAQFSGKENEEGFSAEKARARISSHLFQYASPREVIVERNRVNNSFGFTVEGGLEDNVLPSVVIGPQGVTCQDGGILLDGDYILYVDGEPTGAERHRTLVSRLLDAQAVVTLKVIQLSASPLRRKKTLAEVLGDDGVHPSVRESILACVEKNAVVVTNDRSLEIFPSPAGADGAQDARKEIIVPTSVFKQFIADGAFVHWTEKNGVYRGTPLTLAPAPPMLPFRQPVVNTCHILTAAGHHNQFDVVFASGSEEDSYSVIEQVDAEKVLWDTCAPMRGDIVLALNGKRCLGEHVEEIEDMVADVKKSSMELLLLRLPPSDTPLPATLADLRAALPEDTPLLQAIRHDIDFVLRTSRKPFAGVSEAAAREQPPTPPPVAHRTKSDAARRNSFGSKKDAHAPAAPSVAPRPDLPAASFITCAVHAFNVQLKHFKKQADVKPLSSAGACNEGVLATRLHFLKDLYTGLLAITEAERAEEFMTVERVSESSGACSEGAKHKPMNRYVNILPYDATRVVLAVEKGDENMDYVNASFVTDNYGRNAYIASQAPPPAAISSFWRMIWQVDCGIILMLTNCMEGGQVKCHVYWPEDEGETVNFANFSVTYLASHKYNGFEKRTFLLRRSGSNVTKQVVQFWYTSWPDHGVPTDPEHFLEFRTEVRIASASAPAGPITVHCSAGVGRSGTFIAVDRILEWIETRIASIGPSSLPESGERIDVSTIVHDLRRCRTKMVQTKHQYDFVYDAVLDGMRGMIDELAHAIAEEKAAAAADAAQNDSSLPASQVPTRGASISAPADGVIVEELHASVPQDIRTSAADYQASMDDTLPPSPQREATEEAAAEAEEAGNGSPAPLREGLYDVMEGGSRPVSIVEGNGEPQGDGADASKTEGAGEGSALATARRNSKTFLVNDRKIIETLV